MLSPAILPQTRIKAFTFLLIAVLAPAIAILAEATALLTQAAATPAPAIAICTAATATPALVVGLNKQTAIPRPTASRLLLSMC